MLLVLLVLLMVVVVRHQIQIPRIARERSTERQADKQPSSQVHATRLRRTVADDGKHREKGASSESKWVVG